MAIEHEASASVDSQLKIQFESGAESQLEERENLLQDNQDNSSGEKQEPLPEFPPANEAPAGAEMGHTHVNGNDRHARSHDTTLTVTSVPAPSAPSTTKFSRSHAELLRWRADVLLDEMMLGAVDGVANGSTHGVNQLSAGHAQMYGAAASSLNGAASQAPSDSSASRDNSLTLDNSTSIDSTFDNSTLQGEAAHRNMADDEDSTAHVINSFVQGQAEQAADNPWLLSADRHYTGTGNGAQSVSAGATQAGSIQTGSASPQLGPIRGQRAPVAEPILVGGSASGDSTLRDQNAAGVKVNKYSTLLPRSSSVTMNALANEVESLSKELKVTETAGYVLHERAQHLLQKARAILSSGGERSIEVEYYLQQVRSILKQAQQRLVASHVYHKRLKIYAVAWLLLGAVVLLGRYLFWSQAQAFLASLFLVPPTNWLLSNVMAILGVMAAGALGSAAGALYNMRRHARQKYGIFDRTYSTRGLMLPIIGLCFGLLIYIPFALLALAIGSFPSANLLLSTVPALAALAFGAMQENLYGTLD